MTTGVVSLGPAPAASNLILNGSNSGRPTSYGLKDILDILDQIGTQTRTCTPATVVEVQTMAIGGMVLNSISKALMVPIAQRRMFDEKEVSSGLMQH